MAADDTNIDLTPYREQYSFYARKLLSDLGLGDIQQPQRGELLAAIEQYVQQVLTNTLLENLTDDQIETVESMLDNGSSNEEVITHLMATMPNVDVVMGEALAKTYAQLKKESKQMATALGLHISEMANSDQPEVTPNYVATEDTPDATDKPLAP